MNVKSEFSVHTRELEKAKTGQKKLIEKFDLTFIIV